MSTYIIYLFYPNKYNILYINTIIADTQWGDHTDKGFNLYLNISSYLKLNYVISKSVAVKLCLVAYKNEAYI
jgi:hypothetical protein